MLCSTRIPGPAEGHGAFVERVLTGIGLGDIPFYGQTLNRCVNLLAAIDLASALVEAGPPDPARGVPTPRLAGESPRGPDIAPFPARGPARRGAPARRGGGG